MGDVKSIFPADSFCVVAENAKEEIEHGIIIGYDHEGYLSVFGGGLNDGKRTTQKDWLWLIEQFKRKMLQGDYSE
jgi:hypothetical protein